MIIKDKVRFYLMLLALLQAVIIYFLWNRTCPPCYEAGERTVKHDTVWMNKPLEPIVVKVPEAFKSVAKKSVRKKSLHTEKIGNSTNVFSPTSYYSFSDSGNITELSPCDTINYYSDTTINPMPDSCIIVVNDTLENNRITGRSIWLAFRIPQITTTITEVKKEKLKFYLGGSFTLNAKEFNRWGVGVTGALAIPKIGMADYTYDIRNNAHTIGVLALIRFKK